LPETPIVNVPLPIVGNATQDGAADPFARKYDPAVPDANIAVVPAADW
jgi:hypothetical protein